MTATGPPPAAPEPKSSEVAARLDRRRRAAELLKKQQHEQEEQLARRRAQRGGKSPVAKRFWKEVSVRQGQAESGVDAWLVYLDTRPVRNPLLSKPLEIPPGKSHLATAIALEWDLLTSAQQALRPHLIPLTSLASRAQALSAEDSNNAAQGSSKATGGAGVGIRYEIVNTLLRYLDTDTILCWEGENSGEQQEELVAPQSGSSIRSQVNANQRVQSAQQGNTLREMQMAEAKPILSYLTSQVWPGVELVPSLAEDGSILPRLQPAATRAVIKGWLTGLPAWDLVALERATIAGKSLCVGVRLVDEWRRRGLSGQSGQEVAPPFGLEEAARACSLEVDWQTRRWGEVEDTHDVEKADLRRQLGAAVLLALSRPAQADFS